MGGGEEPTMHTFLAGRVLVKTGDITREPTDAIVNAANASLMGGGGVDGAIHSAGGPAIIEECRTIRKETYPEGLPTGKAVITSAGDMPASRVIHTVGPVWDTATPPAELDALLSACYTNSLALARENRLATVAFPAISTGVFGFPQERAAGVASKAVRDFLAGDEEIEKVVFVFFSPDAMQIFLDNNVFESESERV